MADYKVTDTELTSIANAIRTKGGTQAQLEFPTGFVSAVQAIPTGGGSTLITKNITQNGTYNASSDNADGYSQVIVNVSGGSVDDGVIYKDGYINVPMKTHTSQENQIADFRATHIHLEKIRDTNTGFSLGTSQAVDVTNYNTLYLRAKITVANAADSYGSMFGISNSFNDYARSNWKNMAAGVSISPASESEQELRVDISSFTGSYFVMLSGYAITAEIYEIGLKNI